MLLTYILFWTSFGEVYEVPDFKGKPIVRIKILKEDYEDYNDFYYLDTTDDWDNDWENC